jgi:hypothetical protein
MDATSSGVNRRAMAAKRGFQQPTQRSGQANPDRPAIKWFYME